MSLTDDILRFVNSRYFEPARLRGENHVELISGKVHREMGLHSKMPSVCQALRSKQIKVYGVTLESEIRLPHVKNNSSTNRFTYLIKSDGQQSEGSVTPGQFARVNPFSKEEEKAQPTVGRRYDYSKEWFYEGNVQIRIAAYMRDFEDFELLNDPSIDIHRHGPDIEAMKASVKWLVEVKGYPSDRYVRDVPGGQMGEMKKTNPRLQAYHWFGDALLKVLRLKCKQPKLEVALGFPEKDVYLKLIREIDPVREGFRIRVYLVRHDGSVRRLDNSESGNKFDGTIEKFLEGKGNLV